jgi:osmotically-inducible protein OsmY
MKTKIQNAGMALCVSAALAVVAGCDKTPTATDGRLDGDRAERSPGEMVDDKVITEKVKAALNADAVKFPDVEVASYQGTVQLSGFVALDDQKDRAGDLAKNVAGVKKVENKITLKPERKAP